MTEAAVVPQKLDKGAEDKVKTMMRDICGPMLSELIKEQMATFRETMEKEAKEGAIPSWLKNLAANAGANGGSNGQATTPALDKAMTEENGLQLVKGRGSALSRMLTAIASEASKAGRWTREDWYKARYGEDDLYNILVGSVDHAKALAATDAVSGGFLVPDAQSMEVIELLRPASVFRQMMPNMEPMENGKLTIPGLATGASATYIGENANIGVSPQTFRQLEMVAKKLAVLVPISNDLIRRRAGTSNLVRDDLVAAIGQKSDAAFIRSDGTLSEPRGLRYRANSANLINVEASVITENVMLNLGEAMLALMNNNVRMIRPGWLMSPRSWMAIMLMSTGLGQFFMMPELSNRRLFGYPIGVTNNIPNNLAVTGTAESEIYFVDFADVVIGESTTIVLDASAEAAYYDGSTVQAAFSLDQTVLRAIVEHDITLRHDYSCSVLIDVDWNPGITT